MISAMKCQDMIFVTDTTTIHAELDTMAKWHMVSELMEDLLITSSQTVQTQQFSKMMVAF